ncbi:hypothetical protein Clst_1249 [Thermoclostridium stercorarium subsp. stercorarium DSM 8532]|nr:hypothetical protein Clst_1249 [Thermoclostridium stercorarium subsp. stercorarium DSM 8532]
MVSMLSVIVAFIFFYFYFSQAFYFWYGSPVKLIL